LPELALIEGNLFGERPASAFKRERLVVVNFGVMRRVRRNVLLYANVGRSVFSDDGLTHTYVGVGVKFLLAPKDLNSLKKESAASVLW
jgi:hypothetical protein